MDIYKKFVMGLKNQIVTELQKEADLFKEQDPLSDEKRKKSKKRKFVTSDPVVSDYISGFRYNMDFDMLKNIFSHINIKFGVFHSIAETLNLIVVDKNHKIKDMNFSDVDKAHKQDLSLQIFDMFLISKNIIDLIEYFKDFKIYETLKKCDFTFFDYFEDGSNGLVEFNCKEGTKNFIRHQAFTIISTDMKFDGFIKRLLQVTFAAKVCIYCDDYTDNETYYHSSCHEDKTSTSFTKMCTDFKNVKLEEKPSNKNDMTIEKIDEDFELMGISE